MALELLDSHTHLDSESFDIDREACIERARANGITRILTVGAGRGLASTRGAIALAESYDWIWASAGIHPHDAGQDLDISDLKKLAEHPKVVAIGETGLDFFKNLAPIDKQYEYFELQIELALAVKKPLIIHSRQAGEECLKLLETKNANAVGGVFHCYAEDAAFAERLICKAIPLEQMMVETDAPFMAPEPHRGKRCEPAFVLETARCLATLKGLPLEEVAAIPTSNALKLFSTMR